MPTMQLQQQLSQQQHELLQQLQLLQHQYLMHHGINLQTLFLAQQHNKSPQKYEGTNVIASNHTMHHLFQWFVHDARAHCTYQ